jgi:hypothetical protein
MAINYADAERMIIEDEEMSEKFTEFLKERDKEAHEWDYSDLGEFFEGQGYETV